MNFWDKFGRLHTKPVTESNPLPTNNAYIYTAYYSIFDPDLPIILHRSVINHPISRHPENAKPDAPPISHDELYGLSIISGYVAHTIVNYLEDNHNQYCDLPGFVPTPFYKLNPFKVIKAFYLLSKTDNPRKHTKEFPDTWNIAFWQRPEHRWFYKRRAGIEPTVFEKIVFTLSRLVSIMRWKYHEPNVLLYFSMLYLGKSGFDMGVEGRLIRRLSQNKLNEHYEGHIEEMLRHWGDIPLECFEDHPLVNVVG